MHVRVNVVYTASASARAPDIKRESTKVTEITVADDAYIFSLLSQHHWCQMGDILANHNGMQLQSLTTIEVHMTQEQEVTALAEEALSQPGDFQLSHPPRPRQDRYVPLNLRKC